MKNTYIPYGLNYATNDPEVIQAELYEAKYDLREMHRGNQEYDQEKVDRCIATINSILALKAEA
jgi:hypothetical protein